jgi:hypothetical protein
VHEGKASQLRGSLWPRRVLRRMCAVVYFTCVYLTCGNVVIATSTKWPVTPHFRVRVVIMSSHSVLKSLAALKSLVHPWSREGAGSLPNSQAAGESFVGGGVGLVGQVQA